MSVLDVGLEKLLSLLSVREAGIMGGSKGSKRAWVVIALVVVLVVVFYLVVIAPRKAAAAKKTGASAPGLLGGLF